MSGYGGAPRLLAADMEERIHRLLNPKHPEPWRAFTDITCVLERDPAAFRALVEALAAPHRESPPDTVLCPESCGFVFGAPLAYVLGVRLVLARRPDKLPRPAKRRAYEAMGIGPSAQRELAVRADALGAGARVLAVDDVLASGGTLLALADLVAEVGAITCGAAVAVELERFRAREKLGARAVPLRAAVVL